LFRCCKNIKIPCFFRLFIYGATNKKTFNAEKRLIAEKVLFRRCNTRKKDQKNIENKMSYVASNNITLQQSVTRLPNYIDGEFRPPSEGKYIENIDPSDGSVVSYVPDSSSPDVDLAVAAAKRALLSPEWNVNYVSLKHRATWLKKLADGIEARLEQFAHAESRDTGSKNS
jgi:delta 1-pyrroline-5-carboxylate dehydrogenase